MSVDRVDVERELDIDVNRTTSQLRGGDIKSTIDLNEQYIKERNACTDFRLMLTIKPYCTNVLFNPLTEIVWGEGSDSCNCVSFNNRSGLEGLGVPSDAVNKVKGKTEVGSWDMVRNTEYSREGICGTDGTSNKTISFDYHPGLDIFNNHIIRNKSYRIVNPNNPIYKDKGGDTKWTDIFNTIADYMRGANGMHLTRCCRKTLADTAMTEKHLYDKEDILPFYTGEAITANLREQDGWFGFYNTSVISAKDLDGNDMDISRVINNKGNCEFIDMYPDRTLFSFVPKYNPYRNRLEYNWEYAITYAFEEVTTYKTDTSSACTKEYPFDLIQSGIGDNAINGLFALNVEYRTLPNGAGAIFFRSAAKHNLKPRDSVYLYFNLNEGQETGDWRKTCHTYIVDGVGDINHKNEEYYFYVTNLDLLEEIFCTPYLCGINPEQANNAYTAWDYVRDYFYDKYDNGTEFKEFDPERIYVAGEIVKHEGEIYKCNKYRSGPWNGDDFDGFTPDFVVYSDSGLTNIPTARDWFIEVGGQEYILVNRDLQVAYDGSMDCNVFIQQVINNAFSDYDSPESGANDAIDDNGTNNLFCDYVSVRFVKTNGSQDCQYYVRKFKKVPGSLGLTLDKETYQLAFSDTIYGDSIVQSVFTDNVNIAGLKDNKGRDLTEVFLTIVKTNKGHDKWYNTGTSNTTQTDTTGDNNQYNEPDIEYSHCFGRVTCGFELSNQKDDVIGIRCKRRELIDVMLINPEGNKFGDEISDKTPGTVKTKKPSGSETIPNCENEDGFTTTDISIDNDWFYGDVVEFCPWTCEETTISDVCFRFNTAQRELQDVDDNGPFLIFDEISTDDYDDSFKICTYKVMKAINRDEGYYYKAHYRIPLRELSPVIQDSHPYLSVLTAMPIQMDGIYILIRASLKHKLLDNSKVLLRDTRPEFQTEWWLDVVSIVDEYTFIMQTVSKDDANYQDWVTICKCLNDKSYTLRSKNPRIPENASRLGVNTFLWREAVGVLDLDSDSEVAKYVFANGNVYVDNCFNFYLRRQDPYNTNQLYFDGSQCDIKPLNKDNDRPYFINADDSSTNNSGPCESMDAIDKWFIADTESKAIKRESNFEYNDQDYTAEC